MENACIKVPLQKQKVLINYFNLSIFFKNLEKIFGVLFIQKFEIPHLEQTSFFLRGARSR